MVPQTTKIFPGRWKRKRKQSKVLVNVTVFDPREWTPASDSWEGKKFSMLLKRGRSFAKLKNGIERNCGMESCMQYLYSRGPAGGNAIPLKDEGEITCGLEVGMLAMPEPPRGEELKQWIRELTPRESQGTFMEFTGDNPKFMSREKLSANAGLKAASDGKNELADFMALDMGKPLGLVAGRIQLMLMSYWCKRKGFANGLGRVEDKYSPWPHADGKNHSEVVDDLVDRAVGNERNPYGYMFEIEIEKALKMKYDLGYHARFGSRAEFAEEKKLLREYFKQILFTSHNDPHTRIEDIAVVVTGHVKKLANIKTRRMREFNYLTHSCPIHFPPDDAGGLFQPKFLALQVCPHIVDGIHCICDGFDPPPPCSSFQEITHEMAEGKGEWRDYEYMVRKYLKLSMDGVTNNFNNHETVLAVLADALHTGKVAAALRKEVDIGNSEACIVSRIKKDCGFTRIVATAAVTDAQVLERRHLGTKCLGGNTRYHIEATIPAGGQW
jgi:hypothetical protein